MLNIYSRTDGSSLHFFWAAAPGEKYRISVHDFAAFKVPYGYTLVASYTKLEDKSEPNDTRDDATALELGETAEAFYFSGLKSSVAPVAAYEDWFAFDANAAPITIRLEDVPTNIMPLVQLLDPTGKAIQFSDKTYNMTLGGGLDLSTSVAVGGALKLKVSIFASPPPAAGQSASPGELPDNFIRPYKLTVSQ
jgi:hypothetical protein